MSVFNNFGQVVDFGRYKPVPSDWSVVAADIVNSTQAIERGQYKQVNVLGAAIITALSKLYYPHTIPYIFGGDGVFVCIPPKKLGKVREVLAHIRLLAAEQFDLQQVSGIVPVKDIRASGYDVRVARYYISEDYQQAVFEGNGLEQAEHMIRSAEVDKDYQIEPELHMDTDLSNLECRWDHLESIQDEIICILVQVVDTQNREQIYRRIIKAIHQTYCEDLVCKPVQEDRVSLTFEWEKLSVEYKVRTFGKNRWQKIIYILKLFGIQVAGSFLMYFGLTADEADWGEYKQDLEKNTDYRKFDDMVREVLSGTVEQRKQLTEYLDTLYKKGKIAYGLHATPTVMMTCMVMNYDREHFHFVDGSAGGYAAAAAGLKRRLKTLKNQGET